MPTNFLPQSSSLPSTLLTGALDSVSAMFDSLPGTCEIEYQNLINRSLNHCTLTGTATEEQLQVIQDQQDEDSVCHQLKGC